MDWRRIPSLSALRGFEAAARLGSLSAAARELNVTHAAIAQHVRLLEDQFGCVLLERAGRGMSPTPDGRALAEGLADGFGRIALAVEALYPDEDRPVRISMTPSFAENWLIPMIGGFWSAHPEIRLEIIPDGKLVDLRADGIDLAIRYGRGGWPGTDPVPLVRAGHTVVAAPGLMGDRKIESLADLSDMHWLLEVSRPEEKLWAANQGIDLDKVRLTEFETNSIALQAVRAGAGVSIHPSALVERDIAEGRLVALLRETDSVFAYHLIRRRGRAPRGLEVFVRWLRKAAAETEAALAT